MQKMPFGKSKFLNFVEGVGGWGGAHGRRGMPRENLPLSKLQGLEILQLMVLRLHKYRSQISQGALFSYFTDVGGGGGGSEGFLEV